MNVLNGCVLIFILCVGLAFLNCIPTYFLWNWLMPEIFGLKTISLFQAWGLNFLCGMLFKSSIRDNKVKEN